MTEGLMPRKWSEYRKVDVKDLSNWISLGALLVSLLSLAFTLYWNSSIGQVRPLEPSGYAIIRGFGVEGGIGPYPSDHLVLPMQWQNASGRPVVIQKPKLILQRREGGEGSGRDLTFTLAGTYPDISTESFDNRYIHNNSFLVEPHSVSVNTMVFHIKDFWKDDADFRFVGTDEFQVKVNYTKNSGLDTISQKIFSSLADGEKTEILAESFKMHASLKNLRTRDDPARGESDPWWDYWEEITF